MKNPDEISKKIKTLKLEKELLEGDDIRKIVDNLPAGKTNIFKTLKWRLIMAGTVLAVIIGMFLLINSNNELSTNIQNNSISTVFNTNSTPEKKANSNIISFNSDDKQNNSSSLKNNSSAEQVKYEMKPSTISWNKITNEPEVKPWYLKGLKVLELTDEEFEKLVPNSRVDDTTFNIYKESLIGNEASYKRNNLEQNGYSLSDLPLCKLAKGVLRPSIWKFDIEPKIIYKAEDYRRTIYVAYSTTEVGWNSERGVLNTSEPVLLDRSGKEILLNYTAYNRKFPEMVYQAKYSKDTNERERIEMEYKDYQKILFRELIPVKMQILPKQKMIFWFYPNEEFLSALPERYSSSLRKELELKRKLETGEIEASDACKGLQNEESVFGLCSTIDGALKFENLYPNPESSVSTLRFTLLEGRKINAKLYNLDGKLVQSLFLEKYFDKGTHSIEVIVNNLQKGVFIISLTSDRYESITTRIIKM